MARQVSRPWFGNGHPRARVGNSPIRGSAGFVAREAQMWRHVDCQPVRNLAPIRLWLVCGFLDWTRTNLDEVANAFFAKRFWPPRATRARARPVVIGREPWAPIRRYVPTITSSRSAPTRCHRSYRECPSDARPVAKNHLYYFRHRRLFDAIPAQHPRRYALRDAYSPIACPSARLTSSTGSCTTWWTTRSAGIT